MLQTLSTVQDQSHPIQSPATSSSSSSDLRHTAPDPDEGLLIAQASAPASFSPSLPRPPPSDRQLTNLRGGTAQIVKVSSESVPPTLLYKSTILHELPHSPSSAQCADRCTALVPRPFLNPANEPGNSRSPVSCPTSWRIETLPLRTVTMPNN